MATSVDLRYSRLMKPGTLSLLGVILLTFPGCHSLAPLVEKSVALQVAHISNKPLHVETANGKVEVNGGPREDVAITAVIRAISQERLEQTKVAATRIEDGTLVVEAVWPGNTRKSREGCHITVDLPSVSRINLRSSNGTIKMQGLGGEAQLKTSNGSITVVGHGGPVDAETSNGSIDLQDVAGDVAMKSSNGKLTATRVGGAAKAKTSNGPVEIALGSNSRGPINATSSNGSVTLVLNSDFVGSLDLRTSNGSVKVSDSLERYVTSRNKKKQARLRIGDGGGESQVSTSNGAIRVDRTR